jgi:lysophospholipase L1-like esterase
MRKLLIILTLFIGLAARSQTYTDVPGKWKYHDVQVLHTLKIPVVVDTAHGVTDIDSLGMLIQIRSTGDTYKRDTIITGGHKWTLFASATGGVAPSDTAGRWFSWGYRSHDSVYFCKGVACTFIYKDSIGSGGGGTSGSADSLKHLFVDTSASPRNGYYLGFDSVNHKWKLYSAAFVSNGGGAPQIIEDVIANLPVSSSIGTFFYATDAKITFRWNGVSWDVFGGNAKTFKTISNLYNASITGLHDSSVAIVTDTIAGGVFIWRSATTSADDSGTILKPTAISGAGRWMRQYTGLKSVKFWGAKGDGSTNDTKPIQSGFNHCVGGAIFFPAGIYMVDSLIYPAQLSVRGESRRNTRLQATAAGAASFIRLGPGQSNEIYWENLSLVANASNAGQNGFDFTAVPGSTTGGLWNFRMNDVDVTNFRGTGLLLYCQDGAFDMAHQFLTFTQLRVYCTSDTTSHAVQMVGQVNQTTFNDCEFDGPTPSVAGTKGMILKSLVGSNDQIVGGNSFNNISVQGFELGVYGFNVQGTTFNNDYFESDSSGFWMTNGSRVTINNIHTSNVANNAGRYIVGNDASVVDLLGYRMTPNPISGRLYTSPSGTPGGGRIQRGVGQTTNTVSTVFVGQNVNVSANTLNTGYFTDIVTNVSSSRSNYCTTINSGLSPGEILTIRAFDNTHTSNNPLLFKVGGNISLSGSLDSGMLALYDGQSAQFIRTDIGSSQWAIVAGSIPPLYMSAYPTTGTWLTGQVIYNNNPTAGTAAFWVNKGGPVWDSVIVGTGGGGGGSQTFQQVLTTGSTMTGDNTVLQAGHNFTFQNGNTNIDSLFPGRSFIGGAPGTVGNLFSDLFKNRLTLGGNYTSATPNATLTLDSTKLAVSGGNQTFNNYIKRTYWTANETWTMTVRGKVITLPSGGGLVFGLTGTNFSIYAHYILDNSGSAGKVALQSTLGTDINLSSTAVTLSTGDSVLMTLTVDKGSLSATFNDITSSTTTSTSTTFAIGSGGGPNVFNTAQPAMYFYGGSQNINEWTYTDNANKNIPVLFVGMSITRGFGASAYTSRYENVLFSNDYTKFQVVAGPSDRITDLLNRRYEMASYNPSYVVIDIGTNDVIIPLPAYTTFKNYYMDLVSWVRRIGAIPICLNIAPRNGYTMTDYNTVISQVGALYGAKVIDIYTPLNSGGNLNATYDFGDHVHLNAAGHAVVASTIAAAAPEIFPAGNFYANKINGLRSTVNVMTAFQDTVSLNGPAYTGHWIPNDDSSYKIAPTWWVKTAIANAAASLGGILNQTSVQSGANFNISGNGTMGTYTTNGTVTATSADYAANDLAATVTAHANSDVIRGYRFAATLNTGGFSSVTTKCAEFTGGYVNIPSNPLVVGITGNSANGSLQIGSSSTNAIQINGGVGSALNWSGNVNTTGTSGYGISLIGTITAQANNITGRGLYINPTFSHGSFTGATDIGLEVANGLTKMANGLQFDLTGSDGRIVNLNAKTIWLQANITSAPQVHVQSFVSTTNPILQLDGTMGTGGSFLKAGSSAFMVMGTNDALFNTTTDNGIDKVQISGTARITDTLKLPNIAQKSLDTTNLKLMVVDASGDVFKSYWQVPGTGGGATNLGQTQNATTYTITSSTGSSATLQVATTNLAGLLDTTRARYIDSLRAGLITGNVNAYNIGDPTLSAGLLFVRNDSLIAKSLRVNSGASKILTLSDSSVDIRTDILSTQNFTNSSSNANAAGVINLYATITANRTITFVDPGTLGTLGTKMYWINVLTPRSNSFHWSFASTVKDVGGNTITNLDPETSYLVEWDGTNYTVVSKFAAGLTTGSSTQSGNGSTTTFTIAHGLANITSASNVLVTPRTSAAAGTFYVTTDATNINIIYTTAPASGTNNLTWTYEMKP